MKILTRENSREINGFQGHENIGNTLFIKELAIFANSIYIMYASVFEIKLSRCCINIVTRMYNIYDIEVNVL